MANIKITDLTAYTDAASTDVLPIVDVGADVTKKIAIGDVVKAVPLGTAALPGLAFDGDPNSGVYSPGADQVAISTNGTGRLFVDASGKMGIGTASPGDYNASADDLVIASSGSTGITIASNSANYGSIFFADGTTGAAEYAGYIQYDHSSNALTFGSNGDEAFRTDSSRRLLVGTSTARSDFYNTTTNPAKFQVEGTSSNTRASLVRNEDAAGGPQLILAKSRGSSNGADDLVSDDDTLGLISFQGADGSEMVESARISVEVDGTPGADDMPGRLIFSTTADGASSPTEAMRITKDQAVCIKRTGVVQAGNSLAVAGNGTNTVIGIQLAATSGSINALEFTDGGGQNCGEIVCDTTANTTSYSTTSDYRLKENVVPIANATQRLNQLRPCRFNFISAPSTTFDGFLAHEAQEVVPEAVNRIKDQVDENGNPEYQTIDQSKLVPLLTAALQEALAEIKSLKARVTALEA